VALHSGWRSPSRSFPTFIPLGRSSNCTGELVMRRGPACFGTAPTSLAAAVLRRPWLALFALYRKYSPLFTEFAEPADIPPAINLMSYTPSQPPVRLSFKPPLDPAPAPRPKLAPDAGVNATFVMLARNSELQGALQAVLGGAVHQSPRLPGCQRCVALSHPPPRDVTWSFADGYA
jgi:hypothetical protein